jgi:hypothetical protein
LPGCHPCGQCPCSDDYLVASLSVGSSRQSSHLQVIILADDPLSSGHHLGHSLRNVYQRVTVSLSVGFPCRSPTYSRCRSFSASLAGRWPQTGSLLRCRSTSRLNHSSAPVTLALSLRSASSRSQSRFRSGLPCGSPSLVAAVTLADPLLDVAQSATVSLSI